MTGTDLGQFTFADRARAADLIRYLADANAVPDVRRCKRAALAALALRPGQAVLDVGCGYGADVAALARRVSPAGHSTGVDLSRVMIAAATRRSNQPALARLAGRDGRLAPRLEAWSERLRADAAAGWFLLPRRSSSRRQPGDRRPRRLGPRRGCRRGRMRGVAPSRVMVMLVTKTRRTFPIWGLASYPPPGWGFPQMRDGAPPTYGQG